MAQPETTEQIEKATEDIKQAIITLAHTMALYTGADVYYDICEKLYPGWREKNDPNRL